MARSEEGAPVAGLAAELEDQNVISEGYLSSAECNALFVSACRDPLRKVARLVRLSAGADDHMLARLFDNNVGIVLKLLKEHEDSLANAGATCIGDRC